MGRDEQLQIKKDTLWEIHEQESVIACLEKKVSDQLGAWKDIRFAWESRILGASDEHLLSRSDAANIQLPRILGTKEFAAIIQELEEARAKLASLQDSFARM